MRARLSYRSLVSTIATVSTAHSRIKKYVEGYICKMKHSRKKLSNQCFVCVAQLESICVLYRIQDQEHDIVRRRGHVCFIIAVIVGDKFLE